MEQAFRCRSLASPKDVQPVAHAVRQSSFKRAEALGFLLIFPVYPTAPKTKTYAAAVEIGIVSCYGSRNSLAEYQRLEDENFVLRPKKTKLHPDTAAPEP